jgi:hypothetical protein
LRCLGFGWQERREAHFFTVPLLATPANALVIDQASASAAAARVIIVHGIEN